MFIIGGKYDCTMRPERSAREEEEDEPDKRPAAVVSSGRKVQLQRAVNKRRNVSTLITRHKLLSRDCRNTKKTGPTLPGPGHIRAHTLQRTDECKEGEQTAKRHSRQT